MINARNTGRLLAMPVLWMALVQLTFGLLSLFFFRDQNARNFFEPALPMLLFAVALLSRIKRQELPNISLRDALIFASSTWLIMGVVGGLPIMYVTHASFTDAVFESISALTTTGATVLTGLDDMPKSFLMYRQFLQWMGGLGVVIFVVAVLPMLNIGGMRLLKAETPGPVKDDKLSPRIANTAHYLWFIYVLLTVLCALAYHLAGMSVYDALAHSFTTVSTGGFSTHDASMWYFQSHTILLISDVFMMLGAISFALHFRALYAADPSQYWQDEETRVFILIVLALSTILTLYLMANSRYDTLWESASFALFNVISFITSTGFGAVDLSSWPAASAFFLIFCGYLGGCAGSTAGGNKIIRNIITFKMMIREQMQLLHPRSVQTLRYQGKPVEEDVRSSVMAFMTFAAASSFILTMMLMATGLDFWSSFSAVAACLNVLGPGFGQVGSNFQPVSDTGIWILSLAMLMGRLEYFTLLALFYPAFWRR